MASNINCLILLLEDHFANLYLIKLKKSRAVGVKNFYMTLVFIKFNLEPIVMHADRAL